MAPQTGVQKAVAVTLQIDTPENDFLQLILRNFLFFSSTQDTGLHCAMFSAESNASRGSLRIHKGMSNEKRKLKAFL